MPQVLFLQGTDPAAYPPLINAGMLMAEAGWDVAFLSAPMANLPVAMPTHPRITPHVIAARPSHVMRKRDYLTYATRAARLALGLRADVIYASDILGAGPGLLAARAAHASLVYHEHDAPGPGHHVLHRLRRAAARSARLIVFPNLERARIAQAELGFADQRLRILWNLPRLAELPTLPPRSGEPLILYFHGSISPDRVPRAVVKAIRRLEGAVRLQIVGYQAPGAPGYVDELVELGRGSDGFSLVEYLGIVPKRTEMLAVAARAHIGLAVMPLTSSDLNMRHMTGASNKAFDYMAAGLALLVSDLDDWRAMFVEPGFARACDPEDPDSIAAALLWFLQHDRDRQTMAARARAKIKTEWHYDKMFAPVADALAHISKPPTPRTVP